MNNANQLTACIACLVLALPFNANVGEYPDRQELSKSVERAAAWLTSATRKHWQADTQAMVQYLIRRFPESKLKELWHAVNQPYSRHRIDLASFPTPFHRLIEPGQSVELEDIQSLTHRISNVTAAALHCDMHPFKPDFVDRLNTISRFGAQRAASSA